MALSQLTFVKLYHKVSIEDIETVLSTECRCNTMNVSSCVKDRYDTDKKFVKSFLDAHIVEATLEYFGMDGIYSVPAKHKPPAGNDECSVIEWMKDNFTELVKS